MKRKEIVKKLVNAGFEKNGDNSYSVPRRNGLTVLNHGEYSLPEYIVDGDTLRVKYYYYEGTISRPRNRTLSDIEIDELLQHPTAA